MRQEPAGSTQNSLALKWRLIMAPSEKSVPELALVTE